MHFQRNCEPFRSLHGTSYLYSFCKQAALRLSSITHRAHLPLTTLVLMKTRTSRHLIFLQFTRAMEIAVGGRVLALQVSFNIMLYIISFCVTFYCLFSNFLVCSHVCFQIPCVNHVFHHICDVTTFPFSKLLMLMNVFFFFVLFIMQ